MNNHEFLVYLQSLNIQLTVNETKLKCNAPTGVLTPDLTAEIKERKPAILELLLEEDDRDRKSYIDRHQYNSIPTVKRSQENLALSFSQQRLWFLHQLEPDSSAYNTARVFRLSGSLDYDALKQSLVTILQRHESLRTSFVEVDNSVRQTINSESLFELPLVEIQDLDGTQSKDSWQSVLEREFNRPFDLAADLMLRGILIRLAEEEHILQIVIHHIASDRWSMGVLIKELGILYQAFSSRQANPLTELPIQYADFADWQRKWLSGDVLESQLSYWKQHLSGVPPLLELPSDRLRPTQQSYQGAKLSFKLSKSLTKELKHLSQQAGSSLFMTLLAAFNVLLYRYTQQEDIAVGSSIANRSRPELENLIGFFTNTLALRTDLSGNPDFLSLLKRVRQVAFDAYEHQDLPFEKLVEELQPERNLSHSPIFQVMFILLNTPPSTYKLGDLKVELEQIDHEAAMFDLTLYMLEEADELTGIFEYSTDLFDATTIERARGHFQTLLEGIVANPQESISTLPLLKEDEKEQLLVQWNDTQTDYPQDKCIHQMFEAQVERSPDSIAVVFEDRQLTYQELNEQANQQAHYLQDLGVKPGVYVGIAIERSLEMIVSLLGVLKTGGCYIPLDPAYPQERLEYTIENSKLSVLITQQKFSEQFAGNKIRVLNIDTNWDEILSQAKSNLSQNVSADDLAYAIYTSGSTGKPKGVQINHRGAVNFLSSMAREPGLKEQDCLLAVTTISFDIAVLELFLPLTVGAKVILASREVSIDAIKLIDLLNTSKATVMQATPATWQMMLASDWQGQKNFKILCGGEAMPRSLANQLLSRSTEVWNMYGPTETTIWSAVCQVEPGDEPVRIGGAIANTQLHIIDLKSYQNNNTAELVPIGVVGELVIGGLGLARGYLNRPELTQEKFISNPFDSESDSRLYRTGDLARYLPDGKIELIGRTDSQVKIRGFRIELGEIEAVFARYLGIGEVAVNVSDDVSGDKRLVAYIVSQPDLLQTKDLRSFLREHLPNYMLPNAFVFLDAMPKTFNNKVDRRALSALEIPDRKSEADFVPPTEEIELKLTQIWSEVLGVERVGITDNFFELGGHSLLAVNLFAKIEKQLNISLPLSTLFAAPTIEQLANILKQSEWTAPWHSLVPIQPEGNRPPLFCIHGGGFNVLIYRQLSLNLGLDQPVYGLQARGLDGKTTPHSTLEDMAADYVRFIQTIQPEGPYFLGGLSSGGRIALEMAQQLSKQGQEVALLAMFDGYGPNSLELLPPTTRLLSILNYVLRYSAPRFAGKYFKNPSKIIPQMLNAIKTIDRTDENADLKTVEDRLAPIERNSSDAKEQVNHFDSMVHNFHMFVLDHSPVGFFDRGVHLLPDEVQSVQQVYKQARKRYVPKAYPGSMTVFRATERPPGFAIDSNCGWKEIAEGGLEIYDIPGHHTSILGSPVLAAKMKSCIDRAIDRV